MANPVNWYVDISGSVLSSLFYDCVSCRGDQEGFLFGEAVTRVTGVISDSQIKSEKEEIVISLKNHKQCRRPHSFYNSMGKVDEDSLKEFLDNRCEELIGWYRCRRHSTLSVFAREREIHRSLLTLIPVEKRPFFVFALFCTDENRLTYYAFDQAFHCYNGRTFRTVLKSVVNLGDTSQSEYRMHRQLSTSYHGNLYSQLMNQFSNSSNQQLPSTSNSIHNIQSSLQKGLKEICDQVAASEVIRKKLLAETVSLQTQLRALKPKPSDDIPVKNESANCIGIAAQSSANELLADLSVPTSIENAPNTPPPFTPNIKPFGVTGVTAPRDISSAELGLQRLRKPAVIIAENQDSRTFSNENLF